MSRKVIGIIAAGVLVLGGAAACSNGTAEPPVTPTATTAPADQEDASSRNAGALQAISRAADAVGGTPYDIGLSDDGETWTVEVLVGDRTHDVTVSRDGETVVHQEDDAADPEDQQRLEQAGLGLAQAIQAALQEAPGALEQTDLETEDGTPVWQIRLEVSDAQTVGVLISVQDGSVVRVDRH